MHWHFKSNQVPNNLNQFKQILLDNRGIEDEQQFFLPQDPLKLQPEQVGLELTNLNQAVDRIKQAVKSQQKVVIFGDYDADGICATAMMWLSLKELGLVTQPFIPQRQKHGYGISDAALDELLAKERPNLVITVDNGIVAHQPLSRLKEAGVDVIVTDHHQPETKLPPALAIVQTTKLCGSGVAWIVIKELLPDKAEQLLDLVAIATIADLVPLVKANRILTKAGLEQLKQTQNIGLKALMLVAGIEPEQINSYAVGFGLAPRINAMGRLAHGLEALRLLCTTNRARARKIAEKLQTINQKRQQLTDKLLVQADQTARTQVSERLIVVHSATYHEGVIGLIAGKLTEKYARPTIAISTQTEVAKASARSVPGVNIIELIRKVRPDLLDLGGHVMAAGFNLKTEKVVSVKTQLIALARQEIKPDQLEPVLKIDCKLPDKLLTTKTAKLIERFAPFGNSNPRPTVVIDNLKVWDAMTMGADQQHLKVSFQRQVKDANRAAGPVKGLFWSRGDWVSKFRPGRRFKVAAKLELNRWNGREELQLNLKDAKSMKA